MVSKKEAEKIPVCFSVVGCRALSVPLRDRLTEDWDNEFCPLHQQEEPLLIANVWDVTSARAAQAAGYKAIGTSSAAIAALYGYDDGDGITIAELRHLVVRLQACCSLPLTVDMEYGYGDSHYPIIANLLALAEPGVAGVNLEDSRVQQGKRVLQDSAEFASLLNAIRQ